MRSGHSKDNNSNNNNNSSVGGGAGVQDISSSSRGVAIKIGEKMTSAYLCAVFASGTGVSAGTSTSARASDRPCQHGNKGLDNSMIKYRLVKRTTSNSR